MRECEAAKGITSDSPAFGQLAAQSSEDDFHRSRFHRRGQTVLEQLSDLSAGMLGFPNQPVSRATSPDNVVSMFLIAHCRALRTAAQVRTSGKTGSSVLTDALREEAVAQGYLSDAFAAGHIISYNDFALSFLQKRNRIEAHHYHRDRGVYVINGRGEVWQTFGDGLLHWYPPTYRAVFAAGTTSLREVLLVWYVSSGSALPDSLRAWLDRVAPSQSAESAVARWLSPHSGEEYYRDVRLPSLMYFPMPVTASWSFRTDELDEHGVRRRHHFPQLREAGFHDPDLRDIDSEFLYPREAVPEWMIPEPLQAGTSTSVCELMRSDPNWASVCFVQNRHAPPSFKGLLVQAGAQMTVREGDTRLGSAVGLGYGVWDDLLLIKNVSVSATLFPGFCQTNRYLLAPTLGLGFDLPGDGWVKALHLEGGAAFGLGENFDDFGPAFALGVDSRVMPLRFIYAGVTWRLKYQWFSLDTPVSGPSIEINLQ